MTDPLYSENLEHRLYRVARAYNKVDLRLVDLLRSHHVPMEIEQCECLATFYRINLELEGPPLWTLLRDLQQFYYFVDCYFIQLPGPIAGEDSHRHVPVAW